MPKTVRKRSPVALRPRKSRIPTRSTTPDSDTTEVESSFRNFNLNIKSTVPPPPLPLPPSLPPSLPSSTPIAIRDDFIEGIGILNRPNAKWRGLGICINFSLLYHEGSVSLVQRIANIEFYKCLEKAKETESIRVTKRRKELAKTGMGKVPNPRPTDVAFRLLLNKSMVCNQARIFGHVPGVRIGDKFQYKAQLKAIGLHRVPMSGIDYVGKNTLGKDSPTLAISICVAGGYEDDADNGTEMMFTGQGGNDFHGNRRQIADQKLVRGNLAMLNNAKYGVPVRVIKKNADQYIYDGLWDVLKMIKTRGKENKIVYQYAMERCPGQESSCAQCVSFGEGTSHQHSSTKSVTPKNELCKDYTRGVNNTPVSVVNEVDDELPPGMLIMDLLDEQRGSKDWEESSSMFEFGVDMKFSEEVQKQQENYNNPEIPLEFENDRHEYLKKLNCGFAPYQLDGRLKFAMCILYECGPWLKCPKGKNCEYAITQRQAKWRLQVFRTSKKGWGVRTLDMIPMGSFVMMYIGEVFLAESATTEDVYSFNLTKRPDYTDENEYTETHLNVDAKYVVTGKRYGNLFRFINHSCNPNCFTQPVLSTHLDRSRPDICLFAMRKIFPGEELSYDYGRDYVDNLLENGCKCGSACCTKRIIEA
eukprot:g775.t1